MNNKGCRELHVRHVARRGLTKVLWGNLLLLAASATLLVGCGEQAAMSSTGKRCDAYGDSPCRVSFRALASAPQSYGGRVIRMEGYLAVSGRMFVLSSSKELLEAGVSDEVSVRITGPIEEQRAIFDEHAYTWVSVIGRFTVREKDDTTNDLLLGELSAPLEVSPLRFPIPLQRQTFGELSLDLEDLK